jgi:hypothetical protein
MRNSSQSDEKQCQNLQPKWSKTISELGAEATKNSIGIFQLNI